MPCFFWKKMPKHKLKTAVIIQARMGSTRLPGKVLMSISGKPMVQHVLDRLSFAKKIDVIILAIPNTKENDVLEEFAKENNIMYVRGSEEDVLGRYYKAAEKFKIDVIVRITADCPLIDPEIVDLVVEKHLISGADYTSNNLKRTFPLGLDMQVFNFDVLERAHKEAKNTFDKEHVVPYIHQRPDIFKLESVEAKGALKRPELRLTVDTEEDLQAVREIYKSLYQPSKIFYTKEVINLLNNL